MKNSIRKAVTASIVVLVTLLVINGCSSDDPEDYDVDLSFSRSSDLRSGDGNSKIIAAVSHLDYSTFTANKHSPVNNALVVYNDYLFHSMAFSGYQGSYETKAGFSFSEGELFLLEVTISSKKRLSLNSSTLDLNPEISPQADTLFSTQNIEISFDTNRVVEKNIYASFYNAEGTSLHSVIVYNDNGSSAITYTLPQVENAVEVRFTINCEYHETRGDFSIRYEYDYIAEYEYILE
jgi:hypothetical protein